jgi:FkbM family methyltransferase
MPVPVRVTNAWESLKRLDIRTVIDVGAYDGDTGRIFRDMWPNAELHCFEPQVEIFSRLRNWASTQNGQVHAYNFAVGNVSRIQTLRVVQERDRTASIIRRFDDEQPGKMPVASHEVRVERLDDVLDAAALTAGIFIKIDVEGFEREVMRGGSAVLDRAAVCVIEHHTRLTPHGAADMAEIRRHTRKPRPDIHRNDAANLRCKRPLRLRRRAVHQLAALRAAHRYPERLHASGIIRVRDDASARTRPYL